MQTAINLKSVKVNVEKISLLLLLFEYFFHFSVQNKLLRPIPIQFRTAI